MAIDKYFDFPPILSPKLLRATLSSLPLVPMGTDLGTRAMFRPAIGQSLFAMDFSKVAIASAEGATSSLAFLDWFEQTAAASSCKLDVRGSERVKNPIQVMGNSSWLDVLSVVPPRRIELKSANALPTDTADAQRTNAATRYTGSIIEQLKSNLKGKYAVFPDDLPLIEDFLWEGILNAFQHAAIEKKGEPNPIAWTAATLWTKQSFGKVFLDSHESNAEGRWNKFAFDRASAILEISISDSGMGIASSIETAFKRNNKAILEKATQAKGMKRLQLVHDSALVWALSPFSTRKMISDFPSEAYSRIWRGLYRVLFLAARQSAYVSVTSGIGQVGVSSMGLHQTTLSSGASFPVKLRRPWPWTTISIRIPLGVSRKASKAQNALRSQTQPRYVQFQHIVEVSASERKYYDPVDFSIESSSSYFEAVDQQVSRSVFPDVSVEIPTVDLSLKPTFVAVAHPGLSIAGTDPTRHDAEASTLTERRKSQELFLEHLVARNATPGIIPIHLFLDIDKALVEILRDRMASLPDTKPFIAGILLPGTDKIEWILSHPEQNNTSAFSLQSQLTNPTFSHARFQSTFGHLIGPNSSNSLPAQVDRNISNSLLTNLLKELAKPENSRFSTRHWYWKQPEYIEKGAPNQWVETDSKHYVSHYISLFALCSSETIVEKLIARRLFAHLRSLSSHDHRDDDTLRSSASIEHDITLITDKSSASYLVARRLAQVLFDQTGVVLTIQSPISIDVDTSRNKHVVLFADVFFQGVSLSALARLLDEKHVSETAKSISIFACLHLGESVVPLVVGTKAIPTTAAIHWPFEGIRLAEKEKGFRLLKIDPITNELIPEELENEWEAYREVVWRNPLISEKRKQVYAPSIRSGFTYAIQLVDNRVHLMRWETRAILENTSAIDDVVDRISSWHAQHTSKADVVLFCRETSSCSVFLPRIGQRVLRALATKQARTKQTSNAGVFIAVIASHIYHGKQTLRGGVEVAIRSCKRASLGKSFGTGSLFLEGIPTVPSPGFFAVYLDNSAISGRALREFIGSFDYPEPTPKPSQVLLFPLITKMSPNQEKLFRHIKTYRSFAGGGTRPIWDIEMDFTSVIQLRVRTFPRISHTVLYSRMERLVERAVAYSSDELDNFSVDLRSAFERIASLSEGSGIQCPLDGPIDSSRLQEVSSHVVDLRRLISLHQQGGPYSVEIIELLRRLIVCRDPGVFLLFALEPDLLDEDSVVAALNADLAEFCVNSLSISIRIEAKKNALWVLSQMPYYFEKYGLDVFTAVRRDADCLRCFAGLALFGLPIRASQAVIEKVARGFTQADDDIEACRAILRLLKSERLFPFGADRTKSLSRGDARKIVFKFILDSRYHHGDDAFSGWQTLQMAADVKAGGASTELVAEVQDIWRRCGIFQFIVDRVVPAMQALARLLRADGAVARDLLGAARRAVGYAIELEEVLSDPTRRSEELFYLFQQRWRVLVQNTFQRAWDVLVSERGELVLLERTHTTVERDVGIFDRLIFRALQDPFACLLHALMYEMQEQQAYKIVLNGHECGLISSRAMIVDLIKGLWREGSAMVVCWEEGRSLNKAFKIFAGNVRRYADRLYPIAIDMYTDESRRGTIVEVRNRRLQQSDTGQTTGNRDISTWMSKVKGIGGSGSFTPGDPAKEEYACVFFIPELGQSLPLGYSDDT